jgi:hypothetical protein
LTSIRKPSYSAPKKCLPKIRYNQDKAIEYLKKIETKNIKNPDEIIKLINYLELRSPYIPCYEARKQLGLRNSSHIGEFATDLLVVFKTETKVV